MTARCWGPPRSRTNGSRTAPHLDRASRPISVRRQHRPTPTPRVARRGSTTRAVRDGFGAGPAALASPPRAGVVPEGPPDPRTRSTHVHHRLIPSDGLARAVDATRRPALAGEVLTPPTTATTRARARRGTCASTSTPPSIVVAESVADIAEAVRFARAGGSRVAIQATGHGVARAADGAVLIVTSDADRRHDRSGRPHRQRRRRRQVGRRAGPRPGARPGAAARLDHRRRRRRLHARRRHGLAGPSLRPRRPTASARSTSSRPTASRCAPAPTSTPSCSGR